MEEFSAWPDSDPSYRIDSDDSLSISYPDSVRMSEELVKVRLDRWLWAVRLFKTRNQAAEACKGGKVHVNGDRAKPSRFAQVGDVIEVQKESLKRTVKVTAFLEKRVGAKLVEQFLEDLTPDEEYERRETLAQNILKRDRGLGRPTKKDRREMEKLLGE